MGHSRETDNRPGAWRGPLGWALFVLGGAERVIGWGGSLDFLISRSKDPGWVGSLLTAIATNQSYIGFAMMLAGVAFIVWNERRRTERLLEARLGWSPSPQKVANPAPLELASQPDTSDEAPSEEKIWLGSNITPIFLVEQHDNKTSVEANDITDKYLGNWMKADGFIRDMFQLSNNWLLIALSHPRTVIFGGFEMQQPVEIHATFRDDFKRLKLRRAGDFLSITGRLKSVSYGRIDLDDCALVKAMTQGEIKALAPSPPPPPNTAPKTQP